MAKDLGSFSGMPESSIRDALKGLGLCIMEGDCLDAMVDLPDCSIDAVVTSPPYNIGIKYNSYTDNRPRAEYLSWLEAVGDEIARVLKQEGSLFLNVGFTGSDPWIAMDVANAFRKNFILQNQISWVKSISIGDDTEGHFKPISSPRYLNNNFELLYHFTLSGKVPIDRLSIGVPYKDKSNIKRWNHAKSDRRCAGNTWFIPYETVKSKEQKFNHPAGYPVALAEKCLRLHGTEEGVVLDPFLGAGTTLIAARNIGWSGVGIEIDADYTRVARKRTFENVS